MNTPHRHYKTKLVHGDEPKKPLQPTFEELVEANRERVLELESRGYTRDYIGSRTKLPWAVIEACLKPAPPKKGKRT